MSTMKLMLAELRKMKGITQSELAEHIGVSFQSVSKWENGTTKPDIELLPVLAEYFQVSVDEILGIKPLAQREYIPSGTDSSEFWSRRLEYIKNTREEFWNEDYLDFLVNKVWKITEPIRIIHFGCRCGDLGMMLLPILPKGSTYTGIEVSEILIDEAKALFKDSGYKTEFIKCNLNSFQAKEPYDMAICQALLRHLPNPRDILRKMTESVTAGGRVVCIEVNREFENAGLYIDGMVYNLSGKTQVMQKLWQTEFASEGRDYSVGIKIPFYMQELGLKQVDVRLNDKISFISPHKGEEWYNKALSALMAANKWNRTMSEDEKEGVIAHFMNRGLTRAEGEVFTKSESDISAYLMENQGQVSLLKAYCLLISYGIK